MNKCLVTKLNGSSNNPELLRLGEMRMKILKVSNPTEHTQGFGIGVNKTVTLEIVSDGYFTDKTLTENKGKNVTLNVGLNDIWVNGNSDVEIAILDKYSLTNISAYYQGEQSVDAYGNNIKFSISDLKYSTALANLALYNTQVSGDIDNLKNLTALTTLYFDNTQISGDIAALKNLTGLTELSLKRGKFTGDLAMLPSKCRFVSFQNDKGSVFTWGTRQSTAKIVAIEGNVRITNIDKMLQDQAACQIGFDGSSPSYFKIISATGTRSSASDAAVQTLQSKGYTVSITPA